MMYRACSRCGKIHPANVSCSKGRTYSGGEERRLRSSWAWNKKSREIRDKAQHLCEVCRDQGRYTHDHLEVHHIQKVSEHPERLLDDNNCICLCVEHHKDADAHALSDEYLYMLVHKREERFPGGV